MPRPLIGPQPTDETPFARVARPIASSAVALEARLREHRSPRYVAALTTLDSGSHTVDATEIAAALAAVDAEFSDVVIEARPAGLVAKCGLGQTFEVHSLDLERVTAVHVRSGQKLPDGLERARALAMHPQYVFVEVYPDAMRAVRADGTVNVVSGS
jgi:hypothetical protein